MQHVEMEEGLVDGASIESTIDACRRSHRLCLQMAKTHYLKNGRASLTPELRQRMLECAEICRTAAITVAPQVPLHAAVCEACAAMWSACVRNELH